MANTSLKNFRVSEEYLAELLGPLDPARLLKLKLPFLEERWTLKVVAQTQIEMLTFPLCMITFKCVPEGCASWDDPEVADEEARQRRSFNLMFSVLAMRSRTTYRRTVSSAVE